MFCNTTFRSMVESNSSKAKPKVTALLLFLWLDGLALPTSFRSGELWSDTDSGTTRQLADAQMNSGCTVLVPLNLTKCPQPGCSSFSGVGYKS